MSPEDSGATISAPSTNRSRLVGIGALVVTVLVWSTFFLSLRFGSKVSLPPIEIAIFRFLPASLIFLPILIRRRKRILEASPILMIMMIIGAGLPYLIVAGHGFRFAPVSDGSTILPGLIAVFVSLLGVLVLHRPINRSRWLGLGLILLGVIGMLQASIDHPSVRLFEGYLILIGAAIMWSMFTLAFDRSGLQPIEAAVVVTFGSLPFVAVSILFRGGPSEVLDLDLNSVIWMFIGQGLVVGLISTISYAIAIRHLGAAIASLAGALTPVVSTLLAIPFLGEMPLTHTVGGMVFVVAGVVLASRR